MWEAEGGLCPSSLQLMPTDCPSLRWKLKEQDSGRRDMTWRVLPTLALILVCFPLPSLGRRQVCPCHRKPALSQALCRTILMVNLSSPTATWLKHHLFTEVQATVCIDLMYLFPLWAPGMRAGAASDPPLYLCQPSRAHGGSIHKPSSTAGT